MSLVPIGIFTLVILEYAQKMSTVSDWFAAWSESYDHPKPQRATISVVEIGPPSSPSKNSTAPIKSIVDDNDDDTVLEISPIEFE